MEGGVLAGGDGNGACVVNGSAVVSDYSFGDELGGVCGDSALGGDGAVDVGIVDDGEAIAEGVVGGIVGGGGRGNEGMGRY